jgi:hypothetical protein
MDEQETQSLTWRIFSIDGTTRIRYRHPDCAGSRSGELSRWQISYQSYIITLRATAWPDFGNIWSLPFIFTRYERLDKIDGRENSIYDDQV